MNRKQKIIVSVVGITIVLLALLGLTYAYYLTRIQGNTNTNSISITTANLKLVYGDGNNIISAESIMPGDVIGPKTFTVTNTGNTTIDNYSVVLEYAYVTEDDEVIVPSVFERPQDFEIVLTCTDGDGNACNGTTVYFNNENVTLTTASIDPSEVHNYSLTINYLEPGLDQSNDMGKNLNLKVQIYGVSETADIIGTITGVDEAYVVKLESDTKISTITSNSGTYNYSFSGVPVGTHTLTVLDSTGTVVNSQKLVLQKGTESGVSTTTIDSATVPLITITETNRVISLTTSVDTTNNTVTSTGNSVNTFNPYSNNTSSLAYNIINNSEAGTNGTTYSEAPITTPGKGAGNIVYTGITDPTSYSSTTSYTSKWYVYSSTYKIDTDGYFTLTDPQVGLFTEVASDMIGKYVLSYSGYADEATAKSSMNIESSMMYKIGDSTTTSKLYRASVTKVSENTESILTKTIDDYGTSYYYRCGVIDNYVNFAGMCWRIVRIVGDGSIKLILEDLYAECDDTSENDKNNDSVVYTGNWSDGNKYVFGYDSNNRVNFLNYSGGLADSFKTFQTNKLSGLFDNLKSGDWCYDDTVTEYKYYDSNYNEVSSPVDDGYTNEYYGAYTRIKTNKQPSLKCTGTKLTSFSDNTSMYVGTLTADETSFAGSPSSNYYLVNSYSSANDIVGWWSLSPSYYASGDKFDNALFLCNGVLNEYSIMLNSDVHSRSAVSLVAGTTISSGDGTIEKPYVINVE